MEAPSESLLTIDLRVVVVVVAMPRLDLRLLLRVSGWDGSNLGSRRCVVPKWSSWHLGLKGGVPSLDPRCLHPSKGLQ